MMMRGLAPWTRGITSTLVDHHIAGTFNAGFDAALGKVVP